MAVLIVLALVSITLALSYAMMRTQTVSSQIQVNLLHRDNARQAAYAGMAIALRKMHQSDWQGVDSVVSGNLSTSESFRVTYRTGDDSLTADAPDYAEYPFRVTLLATGTSLDPDNPGVRAEHQVRTVVQLVRRQLSAEPANWLQLQQYDAGTPYTIYQWGNVAVPLEVPMRVEGAVRLQGPVEVGTDYEWVDNRPFDGLLDEVAVFQRALTEGQLAAIYRGGAGKRVSRHCLRSQLPASLVAARRNRRGHDSHGPAGQSPRGLRGSRGRRKRGGPFRRRR